MLATNDLSRGAGLLPAKSRFVCGSNSAIMTAFIAMDTPNIPFLDCECPDITVVVVNYNTAHLLDRMFAALEASVGVEASDNCRR